MDDKQLDLNAPILSVRRFTSSAISNRVDRKKVQTFASSRNPPPYKSEFQSGPVRNASSIPFLWEQAPGKRKNVGEQSAQDLEIKHSAPNLPPGRILYAKQQEQEQRQLEKHQQESLTEPLEKAKAELVLCSDSENSNLKGTATRLENPKEDLNGEEILNSEDCNDDDFSDAVDTLSRSESFHMACSISDMSALDLHESKPPRRLSLDPEARDFMMDRFLPAAKAMTSETPQYGSRKLTAPREVVRTVNRNVENKNPVLSLSQPLAVPKKLPDEDGEESEIDYEEYDTQNMAAKACGMLPRFCFKNSFCLLNPIPGMKGHSHMLSSPASHKLIDQRKVPSNQASNSESDEHSWETVYKYKLAQGLQHHSSLETESKPTSENELKCWSRSRTPDGSSPNRLSASDVVSPSQWEEQLSSKEIGFLGVPIQVKAVMSDNRVSYSKNHFSGLLNSHNGNQRGSGSLSPTVEKTLYVDSVQALETPKSISSSSSTIEPVTAAFKDTDVTEEDERLGGVSNVEGQLKMVEVAKDDNGDSFSNRLESTLPPPLPKSPSESWLWRTLPSVPSKVPSSGSYVGIQTRQRRQALKPLASNPKWENMVKTSNNQLAYSRFAEKPKQAESWQAEA